LNADIPWHSHSLISVPHPLQHSTPVSHQLIALDIVPLQIVTLHRLAYNALLHNLIHLYISLCIHTPEHHSAPYIIIYTIFTCRPAFSFPVQKYVEPALVSPFLRGSDDTRCETFTPLFFCQSKTGDDDDVSFIYLYTLCSHVCCFAILFDEYFLFGDAVASPFFHRPAIVVIISIKSSVIRGSRGPLFSITTLRRVYAIYFCKRTNPIFGRAICIYRRSAVQE